MEIIKVNNPNWQNTAMKSIFSKKIRLIGLNSLKLQEEDMTCKKLRRAKSAYTHVASILLQNRRILIGS
jgi:hypothetical protein